KTGPLGRAAPIAGRIGDPIGPGSVGFDQHATARAGEAAGGAVLQGFAVERGGTERPADLIGPGRPGEPRGDGSRAWEPLSAIPFRGTGRTLQFLPGFLQRLARRLSGLGRRLFGRVDRLSGRLADLRAGLADLRVVASGR